MSQHFFRRDSCGVFIPFLAMVFIAVLALVALVVEAGRLYYTKVMFQSAIDSASLRGTAILKDENTRLVGEEDALCSEEDRQNGEAGLIHCVTERTKEFLREQLKLNKVNSSVAQGVASAATVVVDLTVQRINVSANYPYQVSIFRAIENSWGQIQLSATGQTQYKDTLVSLIIDGTAGMNQSILFPPVDSNYSPPSPTASPVPTVWQPPDSISMRKFEAAERIESRIIGLLSAGDVFSAQIFDSSNPRALVANKQISIDNWEADKVWLSDKVASAMHTACEYSEADGHYNFVRCPGVESDAIDYEAALAAAINLMQEGHESDLERFRKVIIYIVGNPVSHVGLDYGDTCIHDNGTQQNQIKIRGLRAIKAADSARVDNKTFVYVLGLGSSECAPPASNDPHQLNVTPTCSPGSNRIKNVLFRRLAFDRSAMSLNGDPNFECGSPGSATYEEYAGMYAAPFGGEYPAGFEYWTVYRFLLRSMRGYRGVLEH